MASVKSNLTEEQKCIISLVKSGHSLCITGGMGTGKTFTLNIIVNELRKKKKVAVTASTGLAGKLLEDKYHILYIVVSINILHIMH